MEFFGGGGGGGDGESQSALGRVPGDEDDVRRDFRDTAYWEAKIVTDANGQATVEVPLPDNTTTTLVNSRAI